MHSLVPDNRPLLYLASIVSFLESSSNSGATSYPRTVGAGQIPSLRRSQSSVGTTEKPLFLVRTPKTEFLVQMVRIPESRDLMNTSIFQLHLLRHTNFLLPPSVGAGCIKELKYEE
ncbi:hypothetical protein BDV41DRAFT_127429 [Aspergillus transmontanensis]|uniref:Uncharacterized protein n=1 Tax=Aspergillus transmontanensis TaxID=1034304 RepID=A0A5N6W6D8_9EURO|nr:hypothetical protein BDV41DRAFT_127429 [Aspergillus transmontanensis]